MSFNGWDVLFRWPHPPLKNWRANQPRQSLYSSRCFTFYVELVSAVLMVGDLPGSTPGRATCSRIIQVFNPCGVDKLAPVLAWVKGHCDCRCVRCWLTMQQQVNDRRLHLLSPVAYLQTWNGTTEPYLYLDCCPLLKTRNKTPSPHRSSPFTTTSSACQWIFILRFLTVPVAKTFIF